MMNMEQVAELVERLLQQSQNSIDQAEARTRDLIQQVAAGRPDAAAIRAEKISKLGAALRKSTKINDFKEGDMPIKEWLRRLNFEVASLRALQGLPDDLTREEGIGLFKDKLDFTVVKRVELVFAARDPVVTWADVEWDVLSDILKEEFGPKVSQVGQVLLQFGSQRFKKTEGMSVASFTHQWVEQLPECMCPSTEEELRNFADLIKRTLFYHSLCDAYIQKELCDMPGEPAFKAYFDQAVLAEHKRKSFQDVGDSGAQIDPTACVAVLEDDQMSQRSQGGDGGAAAATVNYYGSSGRGRGQAYGGTRGRSSQDGGNSFGGRSQSFGGGNQFGGRSQSLGGRNQSFGGGNQSSNGGHSQSFGGRVVNMKTTQRDFRKFSKFFLTYSLFLIIFLFLDT